MNAYDTYRLALKNGTANPVKKEKKPLPKMSAKRKVENKDYLKLRKDFLTKNIRCQVCRVKVSEDVHHKKGRGSNMLKVETFLAVCRGCHRKIHDQHQWAVDNGFILSSNKKVA